MRELAGEFAQAHPKIARRLGMQAGEVADPYVERLIESFCFMAARMQIKLDAEFPRFTGRLLEVVYPNYVAPTPSMAVARLYPGRTEGSLARGYRIARGTALTARVPDGEKTACQFRSGPGRHALAAGDHRGATDWHSARHSRARSLRAGECKSAWRAAPEAAHDGRRAHCRPGGAGPSAGVSGGRRTGGVTPLRAAAHGGGRNDHRGAR